MQRTYRREEADAYRETQSEPIRAALAAVDPTAQKVYEAIANGATKAVKIAEAVDISHSGGCWNGSYVPKEPDPEMKYKGTCLV